MYVQLACNVNLAARRPCYLNSEWVFLPTDDRYSIQLCEITTDSVGLFHIIAMVPLIHSGYYDSVV